MTLDAINQILLQVVYMLALLAGAVCLVTVITCGGLYAWAGIKHIYDEVVK